ncbi:sugar 3,4-ketoisomerase, partial [Escherichia coli]
VICINGSCAVTNNNGEEKEIFLLDDPSKCLILETRDWHQMHSFSKDAILIVFASTTFDSSDYIFEPYPNKA